MQRKEEEKKKGRKKGKLGQRRAAGQGGSHLKKEDVLKKRPSRIEKRRAEGHFHGMLAKRRDAKKKGKAKEEEEEEDEDEEEPTSDTYRECWKDRDAMRRRREET